MNSKSELDNLYAQLESIKLQINELKSTYPQSDDVSKKILSLIKERHIIYSKYLERKKKIEEDNMEKETSAVGEEILLIIEKDHVISSEEDELVNSTIIKLSHKEKSGNISEKEKILLCYLAIKQSEKLSLANIESYKSATTGEFTEFIESEERLLAMIRKKIEQLVNQHPFLEGFEKPKKSIKRKLEIEESTSFSVASKYTLLDVEEIETTTQDSKTNNKIPPILISDPTLWNEIRKNLLDAGVTEFSCTAKQNLLSIKLDNMDNFTKIKQEFLQKNYPFHSYNPNPEKKLKVVIKNIPCDVPTEEIKEALIEKGFPVISVYQLKKTIEKQRIPLPIFYVELQLQGGDSPIYQLNDILHLKIKVEPYRKSKSPTQCHRCQRYGHTKTNCNHPPRCVKCSGDHWSTNCESKYLENPKCVLCEGEHVASFRGCPKYPTKPINHNNSDLRTEALTNTSISEPNLSSSEPTLSNSEPTLPSTAPNMSGTTTNRTRTTKITPRTAQNTERNQTNELDDDDDFKNLFSNFLSSIKDFDFKQIFRVFKQFLINMKEANGLVEKLEVLMQAADQLANLF